MLAKPHSEKKKTPSCCSRRKVSIARRLPILLRHRLHFQPFFFFAIFIFFLNRLRSRRKWQLVVVQSSKPTLHPTPPRLTVTWGSVLSHHCFFCLVSQRSHASPRSAQHGYRCCHSLFYRSNSSFCGNAYLLSRQDSHVIQNQIQIFFMLTLYFHSPEHSMFSRLDTLTCL